MSDVNGLEVMWAIRDARGLSSSEKAVAWAVASRGVRCYATAETLAADAGMGLKAFYRVRRLLLDRGVLVEDVREGTTTVYRVVRHALVYGAVTEEPEAVTAVEEPEAVTAVEEPEAVTAVEELSTLVDPLSDTYCESSDEGGLVESTRGGLVESTRGVYSNRLDKEETKEENEEEISSSCIEFQTSTEEEGEEMKTAKTTDSVVSSLDIESVMAIARSYQHVYIDAGEAENVLSIAVRKSAKVSGSEIENAMRVYFMRRSLSVLDSDHADGPGLFSWLLDNPSSVAAWKPKMIATPQGLSSQPHAQGGRRYIDSFTGIEYSTFEEYQAAFVGVEAVGQ